ncbi:MAG: PfkB family carbohydrate kinase [Acidobacteriota bacterium]
MKPSSFLHNSLIVIGGASLDILHFAGRTERSAGGSGLYTSLAAHRMGRRVTMIAPRPSPVPPELELADERLDWRGVAFPPEELPTFEIAHLGNGQTKYLNIWWRAEKYLSLDYVPDDLPEGLVYCIPMIDTQHQVEFLRHFKSLGRVIACGTHQGAVNQQLEAVRESLSLVDFFFCNEDEARGIFGTLDRARTAAGKTLFITRGAQGVRVIQGEYATDVAGVWVDELDPTGAGDTFCGTTLALLAEGAHPVMAARYGVVAAAEMVTKIGPDALFNAPPVTGQDARVEIDLEQIKNIASFIRGISEVTAYDFVGEYFPEVGSPQALDYFFTATLQQFGFWSEQDGRYFEPMIASINGRKLKGSDYLWATYYRMMNEQADLLSPAGHAALDAATLETFYRADDASNPLSVFDERLKLAQTYGRDLQTLGLTPAEIIERANASNKPLQTFLAFLDYLGGYKEDPLRKKSALLAIILQQRPEKFLRESGDELVPPIVDYHIQRSCLRIGLVKVVDRDLRERLERREVLLPAEEWAIREAVYRAMNELQQVSGCSMGALDKFFFDNRHRCPEMSEPDCASCPIDAVCAHQKSLFQPVIRTTFY